MIKIAFNLSPTKPYRFFTLRPSSILLLLLVAVPLISGWFWFLIMSAVWLYQSGTFLYQKSQNTALHYRLNHLQNQEQSIQERLTELLASQANLSTALGLSLDKKAPNLMSKPAPLKLGSTPANLKSNPSTSFSSAESLFFEQLQPPEHQLIVLNKNLSHISNKLQTTSHDFTFLAQHLSEKKEKWATMPFAKPAQGELTSRFGYRLHPVLGTYAMHNGQDIANRLGTPIVATGNGRITFAGWSGHYGNLVVIAHGNGYQSKYAHMNNIKAKLNQKIQRHDLLGTMGNTGRTTGIHLHYEIHINGMARDPSPYLLPLGILVD